MGKKAGGALSKMFETLVKQRQWVEKFGEGNEFGVSYESLFPTNGNDEAWAADDNHKAAGNIVAMVGCHGADYSGMVATLNNGSKGLKVKQALMRMHNLKLTENAVHVHVQHLV